MLTDFRFLCDLDLLDLFRLSFVGLELRPSFEINLLHSLFVLMVLALLKYCLPMKTPTILSRLENLP